MMLTAKNKKDLPELYATDGQGGEAMAVVKFFCPWNSWTWYAVEFDGEDRFFGLVDGQFKELGYFLLSELMSVTGPGGLRIERDLYFKPTKVKDLQ